MSKTIHLLSPAKLRAFFLLFLLSLAVQPAFGQADWFDDDDDDEDTTEVVDATEAWDVSGERTEVAIRVNGKDYQLKDDIEFARKETLNVQVRYLARGSMIHITAKKGGIKLKKKVFYANEKGQLDLEIQTGGKKIAGVATVIYTPSKGGKKTRDFRLKID